MIDDLLGELFGEVILGRLGRSRRAQLLARLFFGLLGALLGLAGALHFTVGRRGLTNPVMQACAIALFLFLACFSLFNVALGRRWRWPGICFALNFAGLFAARILVGP
jgi:predicted acyltransferase